MEQIHDAVTASIYVAVEKNDKMKVRSILKDHGDVCRNMFDSLVKVEKYTSGK